VQAATIEKFARTFGRQGVLDGFFCKRHGQKSQVRCPDSTLEKCPRLYPRFTLACVELDEINRNRFEQKKFCYSLFLIKDFRKIGLSGMKRNHPE